MRFSMFLRDSSRGAVSFTSADVAHALIRSRNRCSFLISDRRGRARVGRGRRLARPSGRRWLTLLELLLELRLCGLCIDRQYLFVDGVKLHEPFFDPL